MSSQALMPQNCTIICSKDDPLLVCNFLRELLLDAAEICVVGKDSNWSIIKIKSATATLTLNRQVEIKRGDSFSRMSLGMHTYFLNVKTSAKAIQKEILSRVLDMELAIGVVAEPEFDEVSRHYDCIFGIANVMDAIIWTGNGAINAEGKLLLDGDGNSEIA